MGIESIMILVMMARTCTATAEAKYVSSFAIICTSTVDQATLNCSSLSISNETVSFLKGPLVTRLMPSFYIFIIFISLPLNALALVAFTCRIREKKPAVIYMSHLACVDLLFTLLLPLKIHYQLNSSDWVFATGFNRGEGDSSYAVYLLAVCLGSASVFLDPLLYYYGSSQCRKQINFVLRRGRAEQRTSPTNTLAKSNQTCRKV